VITFGDDAFDAFVAIASRIPGGYTIALLGEGEDPPAGTDIAPGTDVRFRTADEDGITYEVLDAMAEPTGEVRTRPWAQVARIHVY